MTDFARGLCIGFLGDSGVDVGFDSAASMSVIATDPSVAPSPYRNCRRDAGLDCGREQIERFMFRTSINVNEFVGVEEHQTQIRECSRLRIHIGSLLIRHVTLESGKDLFVLERPS